MRAHSLSFRFYPLLFAVILSLAPLSALRAGDGSSSPNPASKAAAPGEEALFQNLPVVEAATLHIQTLEDAPASVTIVTAAEIRRFGYRTLADALRNVRGFYMTSDRMYQYSGVRGIAIPGDYNSRFLIMVNGHSLTENVYNSNNFFGQDFGLDMELVERIEIIRGPTSALYGSNGMLASINVITRSPVDAPRGAVSVEGGSFGQKKTLVSSAMNLGKGANLLLSASVFNDSGRELRVSADEGGEAVSGLAHGVDAQRGYHTFANLVWNKWSFTGYFNSREVRAPLYGSGSIFDDSGSWILDQRNFVAATYSSDIGLNGKLRWNNYYDQYRYRDRIDYPLDGGDIEDNRTSAYGDWITSQLTFTHPVKKLGDLTAGMQGQLEVRNLQINEDAAPERIPILRISRPDRSAALFAQQEWKLTPKLTAYFGLRFDVSKNFGNFASPRLAVVFRPSQKTSYKLVYGRPFRNPSAYEQFYDDGLALHANPYLVQETASSVEGSVERKLNSRLTALVNAYQHRLNNVIEAQFLDDGLQGYVNAGARRSTGVEFELAGHPARWIETAASLALQRAVRSAENSRLPNSPGRLAKFRVGLPLFREKLVASGGLQHMDSRFTASHGRVRSAWLTEATLSTNRLLGDFDLIGGVRNLLNWQYEDPVDLTSDRLPADGRTVYVKLVWHKRD